jgi:ABC-type transport system substrate-binding protein
MYIAIVVAGVIAAAGCDRGASRAQDNVLRVTLRSRVKSIDPLLATDVYSSTMVRRTYEGLLQYHYLKRPYAVEPLLAKSLPEISADGLTYTFRLREGVRFQDDPAFGPGGKGRELTAADFVYSFKRLRDWWGFRGKLKSVTAPERSTLRLTLRSPYPALLHVLTLPGAVVVPREAVERYGEDFGRHPVGTGPFRLERFEPNELVWKRNGNFRGEAYPSEGAPGDREAGLLADAGKTIPFVDGIVDRVLLEERPAWLAFLRGELDLFKGIPKDVAGAEPGFTILTEPGMWFTYLAFNWSDPSVGGKRNAYLRRALSLAFDEKALSRDFYRSTALKAESIVPPGIPGFDSGFRNPWRAFEPEKAERILAEAGHPGGKGIPELVLSAPADTSQRQLAEFFQRAAARLGLTVRLETLAFPELLDRLKRHQLQMWTGNWYYDFPDPENGWQILYGPNANGGSNYTGYRAPELDALYERLTGLDDGPERRRVAELMSRLLTEDLPLIAAAFPSESAGARSWVRNVKLHAFEHGTERYLRLNAR